MANKEQKNEHEQLESKEPAAGLDGGDVVMATGEQSGAPIEPGQIDDNATAHDADAMAEMQAELDGKPAEENTEKPADEKAEFTVEEKRELYNLPKEWSDAQVDEFYAHNSKGAEPTDEPVSTDGVFHFDPTRKDREIHTWGERELRLAIEGKLEGVNNKQMGEIISAYKKLVEVDPAWSDAQVIDNFRNGTEPAKTSNGVWVTDVTRAGKPAESWTTPELEAWAMGEIQSTQKADDRKLALALSKALNLKTADNSVKSVKEAYRKTKGNVAIGGDEAHQPVSVQTSDTEEEPAYLQQAKATAAQVEKVEGLTPMKVSYIDGVLSRYLETVSIGRPITSDAAAIAQKELAGLFDYAVAQEPQAMVASLERIKGVIAKNLDGVFKGDNAYRYTHLVPEARNTRERHIGMLTALIAYASPAKEQRKQLDLKYLLRTQSNEKQAQLTEYFKTIA